MATKRGTSKNANLDGAGSSLGHMHVVCRHDACHESWRLLRGRLRALGEMWAAVDASPRRASMQPAELRSELGVRWAELDQVIALPPEFLARDAPQKGTWTTLGLRDALGFFLDAAESSSACASHRALIADLRELLEETKGNDK